MSATSTRPPSPKVATRAGPCAATSRRSRPTSRSGAASAPPDSIKKRLAAIEDRARRPPTRCSASTSSRSASTSQAELDDDRRRPSTSPRSRTSSSTAAKAYGERKGITYAAWREVGVAAAVLKTAGISRAADPRSSRLDRAAVGGEPPRRQRAATAAAATPSVEPSSAWTARSGWGISPTTLRPVVADAGDVVDRAVGVVDVAEHDPVLVPEPARASRRRRCSCPRSG